MKLTRIACLTGLVALSAWSVAACSEDTATPDNTEGGVDETGGSAGAGGKGAGGSAGTAGKGGGGTAGKGGSSGSAGKAGATGDGGPPVPTDGGDPSITITEPKNLEVISPNAEYAKFPKIDIEFTVANFVLKAPNSPNCPAGACGHVHINVDGNDCNASGAPYNAAAVASPGTIDLSLCTGGVAGAHTIVASLHNNDHTNVALTDGGAAISDEIIITAKPGDGGTTSPDAGDGG